MNERLEVTSICIHRMTARNFADVTPYVSGSIEGGIMALYRSRRYRMIAGVCGGMAENLGWPPFRVRLLYVLVSILSAAFPGALVYVLLWIIIPNDPRE